MRCPWCKTGRVVRHGPEEPWTIRECGDAALPSAAGSRYRAGLKRVRFTAPPTPWFSCTECGIEGTLAFLEEHLRGRPKHPLPSRPAVHETRVGT